MLLELDTGGNVRLEEGKSTDPWFRNCAELVGSRFVPEVRLDTGGCFYSTDLLSGILEYGHNRDRG
jgi:hypothetical protein